MPFLVDSVLALLSEQGLEIAERNAALELLPVLGRVSMDLVTLSCAGLPSLAEGTVSAPMACSVEPWPVIMMNTVSNRILKSSQSVWFLM